MKKTSRQRIVQAYNNALFNYLNFKGRFEHLEFVPDFLCSKMENFKIRERDL
jgi:hypothetical protein